MLCDLREQPDGRWRCAECGWSYHKQVHRRCRKNEKPPSGDPFDDLPCSLRGETIRTVLCELCGPEKGLQVAVRKCAVHGECVRRKFKSGSNLDRNGKPIGICLGCTDRVEPEVPVKKKLILRCDLSPGDVTTVTAALESLHTLYPGQYLTDVRVPKGCRDIFAHNPHITPLGADEATTIKLNYPTVHQSNNRATPFLEGYTLDLGNSLGVPLHLTTNRPHLYLSRDEKKAAPFNLARPYWIVNAGVKHDFTAKQWPVESYQAVVDATCDRMQWVQIGEANPKHDHEPLANVIDLRGRTTPRQMIHLAAHASGAIGPVTWLQHLMAAFEKPYVCLLGGREPTQWVQYPYQHTLHTVGTLDCCKTRACWKSRVVPLGDGDKKDTESLCKYPVLGGAKPVAKCMAMIRPAEVLAILERIFATA